jgi:hypothetical protein
MQGQFIVLRPQSLSGEQTLQQFFLADGADPAGHTLAAGLIPEESGDAAQDGAEVHGIIQNDYRSGAQTGTHGPYPGKGQRRIQLCRRDERTRCPAEEHRLERPSLLDATG